jgi:hypothetical protein
MSLSTSYATHYKIYAHLSKRLTIDLDFLFSPREACFLRVLATDLNSITTSFYSLLFKQRVSRTCFINCATV